MYEELIKHLRGCGNTYYCYSECPEDVNGKCQEHLMLQAADAIESTSKAYQMMAEAYESEVTKRCWIPVTERLPEPWGKQKYKRDHEPPKEE